MANRLLDRQASLLDHLGSDGAIFGEACCASADPTLVFGTPADEMWDTAMRSLGIDPRDLFTGRGVN